MNSSKWFMIAIGIGLMSGTARCGEKLLFEFSAKVMRVGDKLPSELRTDAVIGVFSIDPEARDWSTHSKEKGWYHQPADSVVELLIGQANLVAEVAPFKPLKYTIGIENNETSTRFTNDILRWSVKDPVLARKLGCTRVSAALTLLDNTAMVFSSDALPQELYASDFSHATVFVNGHGKEGSWAMCCTVDMLCPLGKSSDPRAVRRIKSTQLQRLTPEPPERDPANEWKRESPRETYDLSHVRTAPNQPIHVHLPPSREPEKIAKGRLPAPRDLQALPFDADCVVKYVTIEGGAFILDAGKRRYNPRNLPKKYCVDGLKVRITAKVVPNAVSYLMAGTIIDILKIQRR